MTAVWGLWYRKQNIVVVNRAGFRAGGVHGPVAVQNKKERLNLRNVVDKSRAPRQGRRGYATKGPFAGSSLFAVLQ
jgi:hypothetical protein